MFVDVITSLTISESTQPAEKDIYFYQNIVNNIRSYNCIVTSKTFGGRNLYEVK